MATLQDTLDKLKTIPHSETAAALTAMDEFIPGTAKMGKTVSKALGVLSAKGLIDFQLGLIILKAVNDAWFEVNGIKLPPRGNQQ